MTVGIDTDTIGGTFVLRVIVGTPPADLVLVDGATFYAIVRPFIGAAHLPVDAQRPPDP